MSSRTDLANAQAELAKQQGILQTGRAQLENATTPQAEAAAQRLIDAANSNIAVAQSRINKALADIAEEEAEKARKQAASQPPPPPPPPPPTELEKATIIVPQSFAKASPADPLREANPVIAAGSTASFDPKTGRVSGRSTDIIEAFGGPPAGFESKSFAIQATAIMERERARAKTRDFLAQAKATPGVTVLRDEKAGILVVENEVIYAGALSSQRLSDGKSGSLSFNFPKTQLDSMIAQSVSRQEKDVLLQDKINVSSQTLSEARERLRKESLTNPSGIARDDSLGLVLVGGVDVTGGGVRKDTGEISPLGNLFSSAEVDAFILRERERQASIGQLTPIQKEAGEAAQTKLDVRRTDGTVINVTAGTAFALAERGELDDESTRGARLFANIADVQFAVFGGFQTKSEQDAALQRALGTTPPTEAVIPDLPVPEPIITKKAEVTPVDFGVPDTPIAEAPFIDPLLETTTPVEPDPIPFAPVEIPTIDEPVIQTETKAKEPSLPLVPTTTFEAIGAPAITPIPTQPPSPVKIDSIFAPPPERKRARKVVEEPIFQPIIPPIPTPLPRKKTQDSLETLTIMPPPSAPAKVEDLFIPLTNIPPPPPPPPKKTPTQERLKIEAEQPQLIQPVPILQATESGLEKVAETLGIKKPIRVPIQAPIFSPGQPSTPPSFGPFQFLPRKAPKQTGLLENLKVPDPLPGFILLAGDLGVRRGEFEIEKTPETQKAIETRDAFRADSIRDSLSTFTQTVTNPLESNFFKDITKGFGIENVFGSPTTTQTKKRRRGRSRR